MHHRRHSADMPAARPGDPFAIRGSVGRRRIAAEHLDSYIAALESRCDTLWTYIQGHDSPGDPVIRFLAADFETPGVDAGNGLAAD
jgi:hypothetical protein